MPISLDDKTAAKGDAEAILSIILFRSAYASLLLLALCWKTAGVLVFWSRVEILVSECLLEENVTIFYYIHAFHLDRILVPRFNWVDNSILVQEFPVSSSSSLVLKEQKVFQQSHEKLSTFCLFSKGICLSEGSDKHSSSCKTSGRKSLRRNKASHWSLLGCLD